MGLSDFHDTIYRVFINDNLIKIYNWIKTTRV